MSTSTSPSRLTTLQLTRTLVVLLISLLSLSSTAHSLHGKETLQSQKTNLRTATHMEIIPEKIMSEKRPGLYFTTDMIARLSNLPMKTPKQENQSVVVNKNSAPIPQLALREKPLIEKRAPVEVAAVEVLAVPKSEKPISEKEVPTKPQSKSRDCYQAPALTSLSASIALPGGKMPINAAAECAQENPPAGDIRLLGGWGNSEQHWSATCSKHHPLYFEEINAERYGYTPSSTFQPIISAAHFFSTIPTLPYKMAVEHPRECIYTLGHYRPGSCVPRCHNRMPKQIKASAVQAGFVAGLILLVP